MKNIVKILSFAFLVVALASCDISRFGSGKKYDYKTSDFVRFDVSDIAVDEDTSFVKIPMTLYGNDGATCTVAVQGVNGTAVEGKDYKIDSQTGTYELSSIKPKDTVVVKIFGRIGEITGKLTFSVKMTSVTNDVTRGATNVCNVTIQDTDGPTAPILGKYASAGLDPFGTPDGAFVTEWYAAEGEDFKIYIEHPCLWAINYASWGGEHGYRIYGVVSEDLKTITIPFGQICGDGTTEPAWFVDKTDVFYFCTYGISGGQIVPSTDGKLTLNWDEAKKCFVADTQYGIYSVGFGQTQGSYNYKYYWQTKGWTWTKQ